MIKKHSKIEAGLLEDFTSFGNSLKIRNKNPLKIYLNGDSTFSDRLDSVSFGSSPKSPESFNSIRQKQQMKHKYETELSSLKELISGLHKENFELRTALNAV
mmetsp:Transcript_7307/g.6468  ORF Transcript_7307/g.6468 Transcript_7307/m.6468 type:complete len:102 (+) Transcript_7307:885-1190(+)